MPLKRCIGQVTHGRRRHEAASSSYISPRLKSITVVLLLPPDEPDEMALSHINRALHLCSPITPYSLPAARNHPLLVLDTS